MRKRRGKEEREKREIRSYKEKEIRSKRKGVRRRIGWKRVS